MKQLSQVIDEILRVEGGYVNDPNDSGGETNYGITVAVARANGYSGPMRDMPVDFARRVYSDRYWFGPGFDRVAVHSIAIAIELCDTGVNMGPAIAIQFLQRCLNAFNENTKNWADVTIDSKVGPGTLDALARFMTKRGQQGETVMLKALNCLQGARYIELAEKAAKNEAFVYGWINNRVGLNP